jgi:uncharacterized protein
MSLRLRPHHLLCMLTYVGKGYTPEFVANFTRVLSRIESGEREIEIADGPDDICQPLLDTADCHCQNESVRLRDRQAAEDLGRLFGRPLAPGSRLALDDRTLHHLRQAFASGEIRTACSGCQWKPLCDEIAAQGYPNVVLRSGLRRGKKRPAVTRPARPAAASESASQPPKQKKPARDKAASSAAFRTRS